MTEPRRDGGTILRAPVGTMLSAWGALLMVQLGGDALVIPVQLLLLLGMLWYVFVHQTPPRMNRQLHELRGSVARLEQLIDE